MAMVVMVMVGQKEEKNWRNIASLERWRRACAKPGQRAHSWAHPFLAAYNQLVFDLLVSGI